MANGSQPSVKQMACEMAVFCYTLWLICLDAGKIEHLSCEKKRHETSGRCPTREDINE